PSRAACGDAAAYSGARRNLCPVKAFPQPCARGQGPGVSPGISHQDLGLMRTLVHRFGALWLAAALTTPLAAQGWIEPIVPIRPIPVGRVEKVRTAVQVAVTGRVARVTVEEWFRNAGPLLDEAAYLYPLPGEAVFTDYSLWQGDQELRGEMMDASQARNTRHDGRLEVTLADSATTGDVELYLPLAARTVGLSLVTHRPPGEDGYFMLLLSPGAAADAAALHRDVVAVLDVSGSMSGEKI